jgi:hypothetical protein
MSTQTDYLARIASELHTLEAYALDLERNRAILERSTYLTRVHEISEEREVLAACCHDALRSASSHSIHRSVICL